MSDATAEDYLWLEDSHADLTSAYCLSFIRGIAPDEVLKRIGAEAVDSVTGVEAMFDASHETWERHNGDRLLVGLTAVGDWTVMFEDNGYLGTLEELMMPLSADGGRVVSHFRNENAVDHFNFWDDGEHRLHFEPLFANFREGPDAETLAEEMRAVGFDLSDEEDADYENHTEAAWALAERLTGVRVTARMLDETPFVCGLVPVR